jgi:transcriptional antiterminator Rof (Rho-off)
MAVTLTAIEDAAVTAAAARQSPSVTKDEYLQAQSDQQVMILRTDTLNGWWHGLPLDSEDEDETTKQSVYDANND